MNEDKALAFVAGFFLAVLIVVLVGLIYVACLLWGML